VVLIPDPGVHHLEITVVQDLQPQATLVADLLLYPIPLLVPEIYCEDPLLQYLPPEYQVFLCDYPLLLALVPHLLTF